MRVLQVEDDPAAARAVEQMMKSKGYACQTTAYGEEAVELATDNHFDLILLDVMLPGTDGFDVCRSLRRRADRTPIIMLTAKAGEAEKVMGLELGADDYVTKPFSPRELRARIKAALRRGDDADPDTFHFGDVDIDFARCEVRRGGKAVDLSALEFKLLTAFVRSRGRVLTRDQLLDAAWGDGVALNDRVVDNHIVSLRRKLEPEPARPRHFVNVRGLGYRFDA